MRDVLTGLVAWLRAQFDVPPDLPRKLDAVADEDEQLGEYDEEESGD